MGWTRSRTAATLPFTLRERQGQHAVGDVEYSRLWRNGWLRPAIIILGLGTFLAILGPYGSSNIGWPWVWFYWTGLIALGGSFGFLTGPLLPRLLPGLPEWVIYIAAIVLVSVPVTVAVLALSTDFYSRVPSLGLVIEVYFLVCVISTFVTAVTWVAEKLSASRRTTAAADTPAEAGAALVDKLPHGLRRAAILSMTAEDHYLRVRTEAGEALILMRLSDAVAACEGLDGARTHRSWWVARAAVTGAEKGDGRGTLILADGSEAPVSRTYYPKLREAGWF
jgi:hypothetical protein